MVRLFPRPHISAIVFDLDGTLYLQPPVRRAMFWRLMRAATAAPFSTWRDWRMVHYYRRAQEDLRLSNDPAAEAQLRIACGRTGCTPEELTCAVQRWMEQAPLDILPRHLRPGTVELLQAARNKGIRLGVFSDYPASKKLAALDLDAYFSAVLCAQDARVGSLKPSPKGLLAILADLGVEPESAVYIGDRPEVDGLAAYRAGMPAAIVGKNPSHEGRGWVGVPDFPALQKLLDL